MMLEEKLSLQIQQEFPDIKHAYRLYRASVTPEVYELQFAFGIIFLLFGLLFAMFFILSAMNNLSVDQPFWAGNNLKWWYFLLPILGIMALLDAIPSLGVWNNYRQNKEDNSQPCRLIIDNNGVVFQAENKKTQHNWDFYDECVEGSYEFILVYGKRYVSIPKKAFTSENELDLFRSLLKSKLPKFKQNFKIFMDFSK